MGLCPGCNFLFHYYLTSLEIELEKCLFFIKYMRKKTGILHRKLIYGGTYMC